MGGICAKPLQYRHPPAALGPMACFRTKGRRPACGSWAYGLFQDKWPPACRLPLGLWLVSRQKAASLLATLGPMACFNSKVRQLACRPWAYGLFQFKSPPACLPPLGLWLDSRQMSASLPATLGPMACFNSNVRQLAGCPWAYGLIQDKCPPACLLPLGLWLVSIQKSASLPTAFGPMACFNSKVRQLAGCPWAYGLFQDKSPPACLSPLGLWLVSGQMAASLPAAFGPMACFNSKVRQLAGCLWAYGLFQGKSPLSCLQPLGLWLVSIQKSAKLPANCGLMACFNSKVRQAADKLWAYGWFQDKWPPTCLPPLGL